MFLPDLGARKLKIQQLGFSAAVVSDARDLVGSVARPQRGHGLNWTTPMSASVATQGMEFASN